MKRDKKLSDISKDATNAPQKMTLNKNVCRTDFFLWPEKLYNVLGLWLLSDMLLAAYIHVAMEK